MKQSQQKKDEVFIRKLHRKVGKAINDYHLIDSEDSILVGLSGGKDSLALLDILASRIKYSNKTFQLAAIHVNIKSIPYELDLDYLKVFCEERGIQFIYEEADIEPVESKEKNICFACSWNRRKVLFEKVQELGFTKLALGHHMDDAVETLLMNMSFQGAICSMPPKLKMFQDKIEIIRPMILLSNDELLKYSELKGFKCELKSCPHERESKRDEMKKIIDQLSQLNPHARNNLYASMSNIQDEYLPKPAE